ncbi:hypothetical protein OG851_38570 [Streptomyces sp. NBC_00161]|uniref:hypothetical protein n=1 Tax=Streptomyces sp. NBC_00161 TaxID=2975671 RepID=UPI00324C0145
MLGIRTANGRDIKLSLWPDRYSGKPTMRADAGCIRHETRLEPAPAVAAGIGEISSEAGEFRRHHRSGP